MTDLLRKAVIFCCDHGYRPYALAAAVRIAQLHPRRDFDICICDAKTFEIPASLAAFGLLAIPLDPGAVFQDFRLDDRRSESAYYRLMLPARLGDSYDRILYLDTDIHVQGGDLSRLLAIDLQGAPVAAVRDNPQWRSPARMPTDFRALKLPHAPYFNSGVLLIDTAIWRAHDLNERLRAFASIHAAHLQRHDQTLLNAVLRGDWAELSPVWNWQYSTASRLHEAMIGANIIHFIGPNKPWNAADGTLPPRFAQDLTLFLAEYLPEVPAPRIVGGLDLAGRRAGSMLVRHMLNRARMARYLGRFTDPYCSLPNQIGVPVRRPMTSEPSIASIATTL